MANKHEFPDWIRSKLTPASKIANVRNNAADRGLHTVCKEARCPNRGECFSKGVATFMIMGNVCTRNCTFCGVIHGAPQPVDPAEPEIVAGSIARLGIGHAVITSVTRDDLSDGGAGIFAEVVRRVGNLTPTVTVEVLIPDFRGSEEALRIVMAAKPDVLNHNLETVARMYPILRPQAAYEGSLRLLKRAAELSPGLVTKTGIMVGAGETMQEIAELIRDAAGAHCMVLTIGQYLRPSVNHHPVDRYVTPEEFQELEETALSAGIKKVIAGPLVRSSYRAGEVLAALRNSTSAAGQTPVATNNARTPKTQRSDWKKIGP